MARNDEETARRGMDEDWLRRLFEMLVSTQAEFNREIGYNGQVDDGTHAEFETQIVNMYNALEHHQNHKEAAETWEEFAMDEIPRVCNQTRKVTTERVGHAGVKQTDEETVVKRAPAAYLNEWTQGFKRMMNDLGLLTSVENESGELYAVKRDPEDYDDPVKDGIQKPQ